MFMKYKLDNGKEINIDENVLLKSMSAFGIDREEAIQLYLEDNDFEVNEEVEELTQKAKENRITATIHQAKGKEGKKREVKKKEDPTKQGIIEGLKEYLKAIDGIDGVKITNVTKIVEFDLGGEHYKLDLIRQRKGKE